MTRPQSHRGQAFLRECDNCFFSHYVRYKTDFLLCFHGDNIKVENFHEFYGADVTILDRPSYPYEETDVGMLEGEAFDPIYGTHDVHPQDICDEWKPKNSDKKTQ